MYGRPAKDFSSLPVDSPKHPAFPAFVERIKHVLSLYTEGSLNVAWDWFVKGWECHQVIPFRLKLDTLAEKIEPIIQRAEAEEKIKLEAKPTTTATIQIIMAALSASSTSGVEQMRIIKAIAALAGFDCSVYAATDGTAV